jgi:hypothetical protein
MRCALLLLPPVALQAAADRCTTDSATVCDDFTMLTLMVT